MIHTRTFPLLCKFSLVYFFMLCTVCPTPCLWSVMSFWFNNTSVAAEESYTNDSKVEAIVAMYIM